MSDRTETVLARLRIAWIYRCADLQPELAGWRHPVWRGSDDWPGDTTDTYWRSTIAIRIPGKRYLVIASPIKRRSVPLSEVFTSTAEDDQWWAGEPARWASRLSNSGLWSACEHPVPEYRQAARDEAAQRNYMGLIGWMPKDRTDARRPQ